MNAARQSRGAAPQIVERLSDALCSQYPVSDRPGTDRLLVTSTAAKPGNGPAAGPEGRRRFGLSVKLIAGEGNRGSDTRLTCLSSELPFIDGAFCNVTLYHVIADGTEPELDEACRVLAPSGDLLVVGLNHCGWAGFDAGNRAELPRMRPGAVRRRLLGRGMEVESHLGAGLLGQAAPVLIRGGPARLALPVADIVLLHARHRNRPSTIRPKLKDVPAGLAPTALAGR